MPEFSSPVDVGNRAAQHCGAKMMDAVAGFNEVSKTSRQIGFVYGKLRRAELERNVWTFATRRAPLRAIDTNTMLLSPSLWSSTTTYFVGSVVADSGGTNWISRVPNNLNNQPPSLSSSSGGFAWEPYFGPMTVMLYDSTISYLAGELVYTAPGDGTYNVYLSLVSANSVDPSLPNQWISTSTYFLNQVVQAFAAWSSGTTYSAGQTVAYTDGNVYASLIAGNLNHIPSSSSTAWAKVPTLTLTGTPFPTTSPVIEWSVKTLYAVGNFVMFNGTEYVAIAAGTANYPNAAGSTFWAAVASGTSYMSLINLNINNNPASAPAAWAIGTTYATGNKVYSPVNGLIYSSVGNGNVGHDPSLDNGTNWTNTNTLAPWTTVFTQGGGNAQWMQIGGSASPSGVALATINITYPIGSGPWSQSSTRNLFKLPSGFLREASQDPKAGSQSWLGAPSNSIYNDWLVESGYIVSGDRGVIIFRFVADIQDVTLMKSMFCEGLALRIGKEVCEPLTQSTAKIVTIIADYNKTMGEARIVNAIEEGSEESPLDDWLSCRA